MPQSLTGRACTRRLALFCRIRSVRSDAARRFRPSGDPRLPRPRPGNWLCFPGTAPASDPSQSLIGTALILQIALQQIGFVWRNRPVRSDAARRFRQAGDLRLPHPRPGNWLCFSEAAPAFRVSQLLVRAALILQQCPRRIGFVSHDWFSNRLLATDSLGSFGAIAWFVVTPQGVSGKVEGPACLGCDAGIGLVWSFRHRESSLSQRRRNRQEAWHSPSFVFRPLLLSLPPIFCLLPFYF
jgi:hypothetical protein